MSARMKVRGERVHMPGALIAFEKKQMAYT